MKDFTKYLRELSKDSSLRIESEGRRNTLKITHLESNQMYSVHPGDKAIQPLKHWIKKQNEQTRSIQGDS